MLPVLTQPLVNGIPTLVSSAMSKDYNPPDAYGDYNAQCNSQPVTDYNGGWLTGYSLLTSGLGLDLAMISARNQIYAARVAKNADKSYGAGCLDLWRLMIENPLDIATVISRI